MVAWGNEEAIRARIQAHFDAGADHVCLQAFRPDGEPGPDLRLLEALAPRPAPKTKPAARAASVKSRPKLKPRRKAKPAQARTKRPAKKRPAKSKKRARRNK